MASFARSDRILILDVLNQASVPPSATSGGTVSGRFHVQQKAPAHLIFESLAGYHLPRVRERDVYYARLEAERAAQRG